MTASDNAAVAARIRGLLSGQGDLARIAQKLGVDEVALRISTDEVSPYPTMNVIRAVVAEYGVDPTWLLTGDYSAHSHRAALEATKTELPQIIASVFGGDASTPPQLRIVREA